MNTQLANVQRLAELVESARKEAIDACKADESAKVALEKAIEELVEDVKKSLPTEVVNAFAYSMARSCGYVIE